jgi:hypothetical protein
MRGLGFLAFVAAVLAAGCTGDADADREPTANEQAVIDRLADPSDEDAAPQETEAERNAFVSECMSEEGLTYLGPPEGQSVLERTGLTEEEFRAAYGFGHSTAIDLAKAVESSAKAAMEEYGAALGALSESEREQYESREQECLQRSYAEFGLPENGSVYLPNDSPINDYIEQAMEAAQSDPRLADVTAAWSACMSGQGYEFTDRDQMGLPLAEAALPFITAYTEQGQALIDAGRTWEDLTVAEVLDADSLAALEDLQQRELATATAHQHCIDQGHDIDAVYAEVHDEHLARIAAS